MLQASLVCRPLTHAEQCACWAPLRGPGTDCAAARAQIASTIIAAVGFNGYPYPPEHNDNCQYCDLSTGSPHPIFSRQAPLYGTESVYTDSTIGCLCVPATAPGVPPAGPGSMAAKAYHRVAATGRARPGRCAPVAARHCGSLYLLGGWCGGRHEQGCERSQVGTMLLSGRRARATAAPRARAGRT
jgi:hypothetical protein